MKPQTIQIFLPDGSPTSIKEAELTNRLVKAVKSNLQLDWTKKENAKAAIRLAVKKELRGKVTISELNKILAEIMDQAEGQYSEWPDVG